MKKIFSILILFSICGFVVNAQTPEIKLGAKGGVNISNFTNTDADNKVGFYIGGLAEIFLSEQMSIQPEILYSAQGAKQNMEGLNGKMNLDYLQIPIMVKYYVADGFNVHAGPQIGFVTKAEIEFEIGESGKFREDVKDVVNSTDFGLGFGAGYELPSGLFFDARYNLGLNKVNKKSYPDEKDVKNSVFQIGLGYKF